MSAPESVQQEQLETYAALLESAGLLHSSLDQDDLLRHLLRSVMGRLKVTRGLIAVAEKDSMLLALVRGATGLVAGAEFNEELARQAGLETLIPIGRPADGELPIGMLGLHLPTGRVLTPAETDFLNGLLGIAASGIVNARSHTQARQLNRALDQKVQELRTLLDLVRGLTATLEPDEVAQLLVLTLAGRWALRRYGLIAWKHGHPLVLRARGLELGGLVDYQSYERSLAALPVALRVADLPESELKETLRAEQAEALFRIEAGDETTAGWSFLVRVPATIHSARVTSNLAPDWSPRRQWPLRTPGISKRLSSGARSNRSWPWPQPSRRISSRPACRRSMVTISMPGTGRRATAAATTMTSCR